MFSIPENRVEHHQEVALRLAGVEYELRRITKAKAEARRERRRLRRLARRQQGRTSARRVRAAARILLVVVGAVAFVAAAVLYVTAGGNAAKTCVDVGTAAWGLAGLFPAK